MQEVTPRLGTVAACSGEEEDGNPREGFNWTPNFYLFIFFFKFFKGLSPESLSGGENLLLSPFSSSSLPPIPFHRGGRWKLQKGPK